MSKRLSVREYAKLSGRHAKHANKTIQRMCQRGELKARKVGRSWEIDAAASERLLSLKFGNSLEKEMIRKGVSA